MEELTRQMDAGFVILAMIFCHIVDDYYFQGILANLKQKSYWEKHAPERLYKYDFIVALIMHAFSWTFMIQLPLVFWLQFHLPIEYYLLFLFNTILHAITDHSKANLRKINLITDQTIHILQIIITYIFLIV